MIDDSFKKELEALLNKHCIDTACNTPDYVLADYLTQHLQTLADLTTERDRWFGFEPFGIKSDVLKNENRSPSS